MISGVSSNRPHLQSPFPAPPCHSRMAAFTNLSYFAVPAAGDWSTSLSINLTQALDAVDAAYRTALQVIPRTLLPAG